MFKKFDIKDPINGIYSMHSIKSFASSLISIYVPIYLLKLGYSLTDVFFYWLIYSIGVFIFFVVAAFTSNKIGFKKIVVGSVFLEFLYLFLLHQMGLNHFSIVFVAILSGLQAAFYWYPLNVFFAKHSKPKKIGETVGKFNAWPKIISLPEPIIAGLIAIYFGFNWLFLVSGIIFLFSLYPLIFVPEHTDKVSFKIVNYLSLFKNNIRYFGAEFLENIREEMEYIVLPIFIFITFSSIISVGIVSTLANVGGIMFTLFIGKLSDRSDKKWLMRIGAIVMILCWIIRYFVPGAIVFYVISLVVGLVEILVLVPFTSIIFQNAKENHPAEFMLFREFSVSLARVTVYVVALVLVSSLTKTFLMPVAALAAFSFY